MKKVAVFVCSVLLFPGCATQQASAPRAETPREQVGALQDVVTAVSGEEVTERDLRNAVRKSRTDEDTRTAIEAVGGAMSGEVTVKYCPVDGKRYSAQMQECPVHHVPLKTVEE